MGPADNLSIDCSVLVVVVGVDEERDREVRRIFWQNPFVRVAVKPEWCKDLLFFVGTVIQLVILTPHIP